MWCMEVRMDTDDIIKIIFVVLVVVPFCIIALYVIFKYLM
jgi:phage shock protein PspC (stress-responsive transcriptional regulator)